MNWSGHEAWAEVLQQRNPQGLITPSRYHSEILRKLELKTNPTSSRNSFGHLERRTIWAITRAHSRVLMYNFDATQQKKNNMFESTHRLISDEDAGTNGSGFCGIEIWEKRSKQDHPAAMISITIAQTNPWSSYLYVQDRQKIEMKKFDLLEGVVYTQKNCSRPVCKLKRKSYLIEEKSSPYSEEWSKIAPVVNLGAISPQRWAEL